MLDQDIKEQLRGLFIGLKGRYTLQVEADGAHEHTAQLLEFVRDVASTSGRIDVDEVSGPRAGSLRFGLVRDGQATGVSFRGTPGGHEFSSLVLAVLNADGQGKTLPDEGLRRRISTLRGPIALRTYVSLTCTNCPDVVQALNMVALLHPEVEHEMVDGALFQEEVGELGIQGVPAVYANGEPLHTGRATLGELVDRLEERFGGAAADAAAPVERCFDVLVLGGGPAGSAAAIYSARKGLRVGLVAGRVGGQVNDTVAIENLISIAQTTGGTLANDLRDNLRAHGGVEVFENRRVERMTLKGKEKRIATKGGEVFCAPAVIIATGASWRRLGLEREEQLLGRGVHFCPHCDGPFYKDKRVAVVGGGNSGIEAAIDLAGICSHVTVLEFADACRADSVLMDKLRSMGNTEVLVNSQTTQILVQNDKVVGLMVKDRVSNKERDIRLDGVFVQIGLAPNSQIVAEHLELTPRKEIVVDASCRTPIPGVYAAGDVTNVPYKQIAIAMGEGAKAALSAFEDRMRGII